MKYRRRVIHRQDQRWFLQYEGDWARDRIDALSGLSFEVQGMNVDQTTAFVLMAGFGRPALIYGAGPVACSPASPETHLKVRGVESGIGGEGSGSGRGGEAVVFCPVPENVLAQSINHRAAAHHLRHTDNISLSLFLNRCR